MKNYNIVILDAETLGQVEALEELSSWGSVQRYDHTATEQINERIVHADIVITNKVILNASNLQSTSSLKLICVAATGMNNVDLIAAQERNIVVKNVKGYSTYGVAQQTFATILSLVHHLPFLDAYVKKGYYSKGSMFTYIQEDIVELKGKVFGIIGLGDIGKQVATIATAFGCEVIYFSTTEKNNDALYRRVELEELLVQSDILTIHAPFSEQTKNLIDYDALCKMKRTAILHNAGRGGIVVEADLCRALKERKIASAALDVFFKEPLPADSCLLDPSLENKLLLTPHTAWAAKESRERLVKGIIQNIVDWENNKE